MIYKLFLDGKTPYGISDYLFENEIPSPMGKKKWSVTTINSILRNEKYKGEAILQKTFTVDYLTKKSKINKGEVQMYHVKDSHQAIIEPEIFEMVQFELKKRKNLKGQHSGSGVLSSKIVCADCGKFLSPKVWHSNDKYKKTVWQCLRKFKNKKKCQTPHLSETQIQELFIKAFNKLIKNKNEIIESCKAVISIIDDTNSLEKEKARLCGESRLIYTKIQNYIDKNASETLDQNEYKENYIKLSEEYEEVKNKIEDINLKLQKARTNKISLENFLNDISENIDLIDSFDEKLFNSVVDTVVINIDSNATFVFKNGQEINVRLEKIS